MQNRVVLSAAALLLSVTAAAKILTSEHSSNQGPASVTVVPGTDKAVANAAAAGNPLTVNVDFSANAYYPLLRTKIGLFEELAIFSGESVLLNALPKLDDLPRSSFRGLASFKPGQPGFNKAGTVFVDSDGVIHVHTDPDMVTLLNTVRAKKFLPIVDIFGAPNGLRTTDDDAGAIKLPTDLAKYGAAMSQLAGLYAQGGYLTWEIFNESNLDKYLDSTDNISDYWKIFKATAPAVKSANPDVLIAGPAFASEADPMAHLSFADSIVAQRNVNPNFPLDYYSFHNYNNLDDTPDHGTPQQLRKVRAAVQDRFNTVPFMITEYENYQPSDEPGKLLREKTEGAIQLLNHIKWLEENTDIETVSWNRFMTTGNGAGANPGGMLTYDAHKRAIYNALKLFGWMPVDRNSVTLTGATIATNALASSDAHNAGLLVWNNATVDKVMTINLSNIPAAINSGGILNVYHVDAMHASYSEGGPEELAVDPGDTYNINAASKTLTVNIPATGIVYLKLNDNSGASLQGRNVLQFAKFIRSYSWAPRTRSGGNWISEGNYGTFDHKSWILRTGTQTQSGKGIAGTVFSNAPSTLWIKYTSKNTNLWQNADAIAALRVDYWTGSGWAKSVLFPGTVFNASRTQVLPWGEGGKTGDDVVSKGAVIGNGQEFSVSLTAKAPAGWDAAGRRVLVTAWTQGLGAGSQSVVTLSDSSGT